MELRQPRFRTERESLLRRLAYAEQGRHSLRGEYHDRAATAAGSGLGTTDPLALASVGSTLYGFDTFIPSAPSIFTINTTTGAATEIGTVSGLPTGYTLDTLASVPEPSAITLLGTGMLGLLVFSRHVQRTSCKG